MKPIDRSEEILEAMQAKREEPTIKVSELREWCEERIEAEYTDIEVGNNHALEAILARFCGGE